LLLGTPNSACVSTEAALHNLYCEIDKMGLGACQCSVLLSERSATTLLRTPFFLRALLSAKQHWQSAMHSGPCASQVLLTLALPCIVAQHAVNGRR
jgi:hypothetical protein